MLIVIALCYLVYALFAAVGIYFFYLLLTGKLNERETSKDI